MSTLSIILDQQIFQRASEDRVNTEKAPAFLLAIFDRSTDQKPTHAVIRHATWADQLRNILSFAVLRRNLSLSAPKKTNRTANPREKKNKE